MAKKCKSSHIIAIAFIEGTLLDQNPRSLISSKFLGSVPKFYASPSMLSKLYVSPPRKYIKIKAIYIIDFQALLIVI